MEINFLTIMATTINVILLVAIVIGIYRAIKGIRAFISRNRELDKKVDDILKKLDIKNEWPNIYNIEHMAKTIGKDRRIDYGNFGINRLILQEGL